MISLDFSTSLIKVQEASTSLTVAERHHPSFSLLLWGMDTLVLRQLCFYPEAQFP